MRITFSCSCGKELRARDQHAGKRVKCPECQSLVIVPQQVEASVSLPEIAEFVGPWDPGPSDEGIPLSNPKIDAEDFSSASDPSPLVESQQPSQFAPMDDVAVTPLLPTRV